MARLACLWRRRHPVAGKRCSEGAEEIAAQPIAQRWKAYHGEHKRQLKVRPDSPMTT